MIKLIIIKLKIRLEVFLKNYQQNKDYKNILLVNATNKMNKKYFL